MIDKAEKLAARGLTMEQIAHSIGIGYSTLYEKKQDWPELAEAIKRGQAKGIATIANALFEGAKSGNVTSQIFYLKCRAKWKDSENVEEESDTLAKAKLEVTKLKASDNAEPSSTES